MSATVRVTRVSTCWDRIDYSKFVSTRHYNLATVGGDGGTTTGMFKLDDELTFLQPAVERRSAKKGKLPSWFRLSDSLWLAIVASRQAQDHAIHCF
jgi:hypothetical protein